MSTETFESPTQAEGKTTHQLVLLTVDVGDVHVVGGGRQIFVLLGGEDVQSDQVDLGVTVLASLGGGHVDDLAGTSLDDNVTVLPQSRALHGEGGGSTSVRGLEGLTLNRTKELAMMTKVLTPCCDTWGEENGCVNDQRSNV